MNSGEPGATEHSNAGEDNDVPRGNAHTRRKLPKIKLIDEVRAPINHRPHHSSEKPVDAGEKYRPDVAVGTAFGINETSNLYSDQVRFNASGGHGFAAEQGNHLIDRINLKKARIIGDDNALNGADRIIDGVKIQSKYCATGGRCISSCYDKAGNFRYIHDGKAMQIEVPSDKYEDALKSVRARIEAGKIPGYTDPNDAEKVVRKGNLTYKQAVNIAKFGTVDSITFDAVNGMKVGVAAGSLSAAVAFAQGIWSGQPPAVALKNAAWAGLKVGGSTLAISVISSQLGRTAFEQAFREVSKAFVEKLSPKLVSALVKSMTGKVLTGAAATNTLAKLLRGNMVSLLVSTVVLSTSDIIRACRGRISKLQFAKNLTSTASGVGGGYAGFTTGALAGTACFPGPGTLIGGIVGAIGGSLAAGYLTSSVMDNLITDDAVALQALFEMQLVKVAKDYLLLSDEIEDIVSLLDEDGLPDFFMQAHAMGDSGRSEFMSQRLEGYAQIALKLRAAIGAPPDDELIQQQARIIGELSAAEYNGELPINSDTAELTATFAEVFADFLKVEGVKSESVIWGEELVTTRGLKKLGNALNSFGRIEDGAPIDAVIAVIDTTKLGTATDGIILTNESMWIKPFFSDAYKVDYHALPSNTRVGEENLEINDCAPICLSSKELRIDMRRILRLIKGHFRL